LGLFNTMNIVILKCPPLISVYQNSEMERETQMVRSSVPKWSYGNLRTRESG
jgi:hypothetical protein